MNKQTQEQETAGRSLRPRKQLKHNHQARLRTANQPSAALSWPGRLSLAVLPAIADFTRLFNFSDHEGRTIEVHRNGAGQLIIDESFCQQRVGKRTGLYANVRQRRFITADKLCDLFLPLIPPDIYNELTTSICHRQVAICTDPSNGGKGGSSDTKDEIIWVRFSETEARHIETTAKRLGITEEEFLSNAIVHKLDHAQRQPEDINRLAIAPQAPIRRGGKAL